MVMARLQPVWLVIPADIDILSHFSLTSFECFLCSWTLIKHWCGVPELAQWWLPLSSGHFQYWYLLSDWRVWVHHSFSHRAVSGLQCWEGSPDWPFLGCLAGVMGLAPKKSLPVPLCLLSRPCVDRYLLLPCPRAGVKVRNSVVSNCCVYPFC